MNPLGTTFTFNMQSHAPTQRAGGCALRFPLREASDTALVEAAQIGEGAAFNELFARHSEKAFRAALRVTRNHQDAEDATQSALLSAYTQTSSFGGKSQFSTRLTRIAINSSLMILRTRKRYCGAGIQAGDDRCEANALKIIDPSIDIEEGYLLNQQSRRLRWAITCLQPRLRHVVEVQQASDLSLKKLPRAPT